MRVEIYREYDETIGGSFLEKDHPLAEINRINKEFDDYSGIWITITERNGNDVRLRIPIGVFKGLLNK